MALESGDNPHNAHIDARTHTRHLLYEFVALLQLQGSVLQ